MLHAYNVKSSHHHKNISAHEGNVLFSYLCYRFLACTSLRERSFLMKTDLPFKTELVLGKCSDSKFKLVPQMFLLIWILKENTVYFFSLVTLLVHRVYLKVNCERLALKVLKLSSFARCLQKFRTLIFWFKPDTRAFCSSKFDINQWFLFEFYY